MNCVRNRGVRQKSSRRQSKIHRGFESLEPRTLMSAVTTTAFADGFMADRVAYDASGSMWATGVYSGSAGPLLARVVNGVVQESYALPAANVSGDVMPVNLVAGLNGHMYVTDFLGVVDDFDVSSHTFSQYFFDTGSMQELAPHGDATMTADGGLWFIGLGTAEFDSNSPIEHRLTSYVTRFDTVTHGFLSLRLNDADATMYDSAALLLAPMGDHGVAVALDSVKVQLSNNTMAAGSNRVATLEFNAGLQTVMATGVYLLESGNADVDHWGNFSGLAVDADGALWMSFANFTDNNSVPQPAYPTDRLIHSMVNPLTHHLETMGTFFPDGNSAPLQLGGLVMDSQGRLWFQELEASKVGYFDTMNGGFTTFAMPAGLTMSSHLLVDAAGSTAVMLSGDGMGNTPLVMVTPDPVPPPVIHFSGTMQLVGSGMENAAQTLVVAFTAPAPAGGVYHVIVDWGDGRKSAADAVYLGGNQYALTIDHAYAAQGAYHIRVGVKDSSAQMTGQLETDAKLADIPLVITNYALLRTLGRFVTLTMNFTEEMDSSATWFKATVNWGDGSTSSALVVRDSAGRYQVLALHLYMARGTFAVTTTIVTTDDGGLVNTTMATGTVVI